MEFNYDKDERVLCYHGPLLYEAKIIKREMRQEDNQEIPQYLVHYKGWKQTWDEWVDDERILKWSDANLQKQQQLKEMYTRRKPSSRAPSSTTASTSTAEEPRSRKRHRDSISEKARGVEDELTRESSFRLPMPDSLKGRLVDDWERVTKDRQLTQLPRTPSVSDILDQIYDAFKGRSKISDEALEQVIEGVRLYFNKTLGTTLLYRPERKQFEDIQLAHPDKPLCDIYGAEHLLRLFVELPSLMARSNVDSETLELLKTTFADFLGFLQDHENQIFPER